MPRKPDVLNEMDKWNFYCPTELKIEFMKKLIERGHYKKQSAGIRALMDYYVFNNDENFNKIIDELIIKHTVFNQSGKPSIM